MSSWLYSTQLFLKYGNVHSLQSSLIIDVVHNKNMLIKSATPALKFFICLKTMGLFFYLSKIRLSIQEIFRYFCEVNHIERSNLFLLVIIVVVVIVVIVVQIICYNHPSLEVFNLLDNSRF